MKLDQLSVAVQSTVVVTTFARTRETTAELADTVGADTANVPLVLMFARIAKAIDGCAGK